MRVSTSQIYRQTTDSLMRNLSDVVRLHEQVSSGKKINKPSDDAAGASRALDYKVAIDAGEQYGKNVADASNAIGFAENALDSASSALVRLKELALQAANGTQDAASRAAISKEAAQLRDQLLSIANSRIGNEYVFSGFKTDVAGVRFFLRLPGRLRDDQRDGRQERDDPAQRHGLRRVRLLLAGAGDRHDRRRKHRPLYPRGRYDRQRGDPRVPTTRPSSTASNSTTRCR